MFNLPDPYYHYNPGKPVDLQGWGSETPVFQQLITELSPKLIIEVGSWKGASAIAMAGMVDDDGKIICIDTWLGALEMWTDTSDPDRFLSLNNIYGYPALYYTFLSNVVQTGHQSRIFPLPMTSSIGAKFLKHHNVLADMIYIDASHDYDDVLRDLIDYWPLVKQGGVLFGDDYSTWKGVCQAVNDFGLPYELEYGNRNWIIRKNLINF